VHSAEPTPRSGVYGINPNAAGVLLRAVKVANYTGRLEKPVGIDEVSIGMIALKSARWPTSLFAVNGPGNSAVTAHYLHLASSICDSTVPL
jgi:hypothetical protein